MTPAETGGRSGQILFGNRTCIGCLARAVAKELQLMTARLGMKTRVAILMGLSALFLPWISRASPAVDFPVLEHVTVPPYPVLARLAGTEGAVLVDVGMDAQCDVTKIEVEKGEPRLIEAVKRSLYEESIPLRFRSCAMPQPIVVHFSYIFSLSGQPTNRWSQTYVSMTTDHGKSFNIEITTSPPDLRALGLRRIKRQSKARDIHGEETGGLVQTIFTSPNGGASGGQFPGGDARVGVELDSDCRVSSATALSGHVLSEEPLQFFLTEEVLQAVRGWQFPGCSGEKKTMELTFHFLLTEPDSPSPYGNWAPTHFEMVSPYEFNIRTVGPDPIIADEFKIR